MTSRDDDRPIALVTGAARRVGLAIAHRLAVDGCDLVITYRTSEDEARDTKSSIESNTGAAVRLEPLDLDDLEATESFGERMATALPRLDVLVHNASIYFPTPLAETDAARALALYRVNALAPLLLTKQLAGALQASTQPGGGGVVCMADIHAMGRPRQDFAAYSMSKAALVEMVRSLARDLAPDVRVNAVAPGVVAFPEEGYESDQETQRRYLSRVPLDRSGTPQDAAEAVTWLARHATYTTGQVIRVDGGRYLA
ncbi:MAG: SDR family oxidoreductase [Planctomycetota bacterium]